MSVCVVFITFVSLSTPKQEVKLCYSVRYHNEKGGNGHLMRNQRICRHEVFLLSLKEKVRTFSFSAARRGGTVQSFTNTRELSVELET